MQACKLQGVNLQRLLLPSLYIMSTAENRGQKRPPAPFGDDDDGGGKRPAAEAGPSAAAGDDEADMCWLCHEDGPDESGQPLRRDCSCRGGSGWAHLSCIVGYAKQKTEQWNIRDGMDKFPEPWHVCPGCKQDYQNELAVELANEFVSFVKEKYPDDHRKHVWALSGQLGLSHVAGEEVKDVSIKILSCIIAYTKAVNAAPTKDLQAVEAKAYNNLGHIALVEGTKESAKTAMEYFEKYRDICEAAGWTTGVTSSEYNIACAKAKYEGGSDKITEEILEKFQKAYKQSVEKFGQESSATIKSGIFLVTTLKKAFHRIEAERLLTKLVAICKRVHGPEHDITKRVDSNLQNCKVRCVKISSRIGVFQALRYEEDGEKCVMQGPIAKPRNIQEEETLTIDNTSDVLRFPLGTPVVCNGLKKATHLNGKIGDIRSYDEDNECYKVHFEDEGLEPWSLRAKFLRVVFELHEET